MRRSAVIVLILLFYAAASSEKLAIAVNDLEPQGIEQSSASIITNRLRNELFKTGVFTVLERGKMEEILKEQGFQQSGCTSDACVVEVGQLLGVKYMVAGSIGKLGKTYTISTRLIDVATGKIVLTADTDCKCDIDDVLSNSTVEIAGKLALALRGGGRKKKEQPPAKKPPEKCEMVISSDPSGAALFLNGKQAGNTPYKGKHEAGDYQLELRKASYKHITDDVRCMAGETFEEVYDLEHTKRYIDSVERNDKARQVVKGTAGIKKRNNRIGLKVSFGIGAAGALAAGIIFNKMASDDIDFAESIKDNFESGNINSNDASADYDTSIKNAERNVLLRNLSYVTSVLCGGVFGITFVF